MLMTRTLKSLIAAALIASSATVAFASDNGDGAATLEGIRNTQRGAITTNVAPAPQLQASSQGATFDNADHSARSSN
jgi:uncharacterized protein (DUF2141 family)